MTLGYTIKSVSNEGTYYLVNGWKKHNAYWTPTLNPTRNKFKSKGLALRSLRILLNNMPEYRSDNLTLIKLTENGGIEVADVTPVYE